MSSVVQELEDLLAYSIFPRTEELEERLVVKTVNSGGLVRILCDRVYDAYKLRPWNRDVRDMIEVCILDQDVSVTVDLVERLGYVMYRVSIHILSSGVKRLFIFSLKIVEEIERDGASPEDARWVQIRATMMYRDLLSPSCLRLAKNVKASRAYFGYCRARWHQLHSTFRTISLWEFKMPHSLLMRLTKEALRCLNVRAFLDNDPLSSGFIRIEPHLAFGSLGSAIYTFPQHRLKHLRTQWVRWNQFSLFCRY